jgi:UrcA family protein
MKTMIFRHLLCGSCLLLADPLHATSALAEPAPVVRTTKVVIADLDLTRPSDQRTLRRRIDTAAREVCGPETSPSTEYPVGFLDFQTCYHRAVTDALAHVKQLALARNETGARR